MNASNRNNKVTVAMINEAVAMNVLFNEAVKSFSAIDSFNELQHAYDMSLDAANELLMNAYDTDLKAHNSKRKSSHVPVIISVKTSGAGKIDMLLKKEGGCTMEEMKQCRGAVEAHISALRRKGHNIVVSAGRYSYVPSMI